jgi:hypothetical protein
MYLRHELRQVLAIRRDWTSSFDGYVVMTVPSGASLAAFRGPIRQQAVYSPGTPGAEGANAAGLRLEGGLMQFVIRFDFASNRAATNWIMRAPIPF